MTLAEWSEEHAVTVETHSSGAKFVLNAHSLSARAKWGLHHLVDYAVSTVSGPVHWLAPREAAKP